MTDRVQKVLKKISGKERETIEQLISSILRGDLTRMNIQKLQGREDVYRVRKGTLRIIFQKTKQGIRILAVERRGETTYTEC